MKGQLPGALLQRLAARLCTAEACERTLFPILADLQFEWQQAPSAARRLGVRLRGTAAFARAFGPALAHFSSEDRDHGRRLLARTALATLTVTAMLLPQQASWPLRRGLPDLIVLIIPAILSVALPIGCLAGVLLAAPPGRAGLTRWRPLLATAALAGLVTFGVAGWLTPRSNQVYRERVLATLKPEAPRPAGRGDREWTFAELGRHVVDLRHTGQPHAADRFAVEWHKKPALAVCCVAFALAGVALSRLVSRWWLRLVSGLPVVAVGNILFRIGEQLGDNGRLYPALAMWGPVMILFALSAGLGVLKRAPVKIA